MNQGWIYREQVKPVHAGLTILAYYSQQYGHSSTETWQERIEAGQILLDGQLVTINTRLSVGQKLTYYRPPWEEPAVPLDFQVLYEDPEVLIVAKPSGLPVLPGGGFLEHTLLGQLKQCYPQETPVPIHRLGRGTSGVMVLARSPLARSCLSQQMRDRQIRKTYRALISQGSFPDLRTITQPIGKISHPLLGHIYAATPDGLFAQSDCQVLERRPSSTLLEVTILTGRPHQIRIHLAAAGFPLVGDPLYRSGGLPHVPQEISFAHQATSIGEKLPVPGNCGYYLHAHQISFTHPRTGQGMHFVCPAPEVLRASGE
jgi:23S rRNA pseudouridine1911/1915/1917 synthase